jgi:hypothetical protein
LSSAGPMLAPEVAVRAGAAVCRDGFCFADVVAS